MNRKTWFKKIGVLGIMSVLLTSAVSAQYLHADGKQIVDGSGNDVILRGMGLGGWMLQEGYMLETNSFANPQHEIRAAIEGLIGEANTDAFYEAWLANHCTKADIDSMASWGFNSVRLPMHYNLYTLPVDEEPVAGENTWLEKGFALTDSLLQWCTANRIYLILDLHAAPGGQGHDAAISDYDTTKASLWESEANQQKTVALWRKLAERYASEPWIGGYDLINETNWNFEGSNINGCDETTNAPLRALYLNITKAIREVDKNHLLYIEGNCWANNHNGLLPAWDNNMAISFHKYWNYNDQDAVAGIIQLREENNLPIWMGEAGENSNTWFTNAIHLLEENNIGWAWWPLKKVGSVVNPLTIVKNEGYAKLLDYLQNGGEKPTQAFARDALMQLTENLKIGNCIYRPDVIDAMFRQVGETGTLPFSRHAVPGTVYASDYDLGRNGYAYADSDTANYRVNTNNYTAWNNGHAYRNDGVDIEVTSDNSSLANGYDVGWTADGEWLQYTLEVDSSAVYSVSVHYAAPADGKLTLKVNDAPQTGVVTLPATGDYGNWKTFAIDNVVLYEGTQKLKLMIEQGGFNVGFLQFTISKKLSALPFQPVDAQTDERGQTIHLNLNKKIAASTLSIDGLRCTIEGNSVNITGISADSLNQSVLLIKLDQAVEANQQPMLSYAEGSIQATDSTVLASFTDLAVQNNLPLYFTLPTQIEAEDFTFNEGLELENTTDEGGGQNIGYTNAGDYLEYLIRVPETGIYNFSARVACESNAGQLEIAQLDAEGQVINTTTLDTPITGGWQTWQTVTTEMMLTKGIGKLKVSILQPEFNLNWLRFSTPDVVNGLEAKVQAQLKVYPNPVQKYMAIELPDGYADAYHSLVIRNIHHQVVYSQSNLSKQQLQRLSLTDKNLPLGLYILTLSAKGQQWHHRLLIE